MRSSCHFSDLLRSSGLAAALLLLAVPSARAQVSCGDTIIGDAVLQADLVCNVDPALTLVGPAMLDLAGHSVTCTDDLSQNGIEVGGVGASLRDGLVTHCKVGVILRGSGHLVQNVEASSNHDDGFKVGRTQQLGAHELVGNLASMNGDAGFEVDSDQNQVVKNESVDNAGEGFEMRGDDNEIVKNLAEGNEIGFVVPPVGEGNSVNNNEANWNTRFGIRIFGNDNQVAHNKVAGNEEGGIEVIHGALDNGVVANHLMANLGFGIKIEGCDSRVNANRVYGTLADGANGDGIVIAVRLDTLPDCTAEGNKLSGNRVVDNAAIAILLEDGATGNQVNGNKLAGNGMDEVVGDSSVNRIKANKVGGPAARAGRRRR